VEIIMQTRISEIADGIFSLSTFVPDIAPPAGFTFNQFPVIGDEPLHVSHRPAQDVSAQPRGARRSMRLSACAGSPSATTRPTSAAP
jgi:hypothetical protein